MIEKVDLTSKIDEKQYKLLMKDYEKKLASLQREIKDNDIPLILVFEGWGASGKGTIINRLILPLDPRGFRVYTTNYFTEEEYLRPFLWTFWVKTPERGRMAIFEKSWYRKVLSDRVDKGIKGEELSNAISDINTFERQLADDGSIILKFYLHISKKEQKKRFEKLQSNSSTKWRVTKEDLKHHQQYDAYVDVINEMLERTDSEHAPWTVLEANNIDYATIKLYVKIIETLEERLRKIKENTSTSDSLPSTAVESSSGFNVSNSILSSIDLSKSLDKDQYHLKLQQYQKKIRDLEHEIYKRRIPVIIAYEGWDAAGKGGNIKRLTENLDPRGYAVIPISSPTPHELSHHYLWRFWKEVPKAGHITIFDRTWYGRVLVERIEGYCSDEEWKRAYKEINEMEKQFVNFGMVVVKFWLHISSDEQLQRFRTRQNTPEKQWKITDEDWRNREKWQQYEEAIDEMLVRTDTTYAPWTIIESNDKRYARIKALKTVIDALDERLKQ
jgi:AMP-polyphosphate phosphotransferase